MNVALSPCGIYGEKNDEVNITWSGLRVKEHEMAEQGNCSHKGMSEMQHREQHQVHDFCKTGDFFPFSDSSSLGISYGLAEKLLLPLPHLSWDRDLAQGR